MLTMSCRLVSLKYQSGFTYLWVLLLVAFMGVALTLAVEVDQTISQRDREKSLLAIGRQFQRAIGSYYESQHPGGKKEYPASLDDLLQDPRYPGIKRHLREIFVDPITGKAEWGFKRIAGRIVAVYSLSEKTPIKQANFEVGFEYLQGAKKYNDWIFAYPSDLLLKPSDGDDFKQDLSSPILNEAIP
ncbi:type II secretion system protein [Iodobacter ciconiae]|uniref:Type II secretion system protein n=1 Tax=Iodobacter ciconiae TaxID=2496266 RepID=A0A3S8ZPT5_9NEIS|nr:type II secretion system protein [Iodobacter ciconiae]AZN35478.1 type II secretion system protein [Iodobacter ciconiae]